jgi:hypothetical protein
MADVEKILDQMRREPASIRFADFLKVCKRFFGQPRQTSSSHVIFKTPWLGDPRINIQNENFRTKRAKPRSIRSGRLFWQSRS